MGFLSFVLLVIVAYLLWRISDQVPDILFRLSEIQRDIAEIRRQGEASSDSAAPAATVSSINPEND